MVFAAIFRIFIQSSVRSSNAMACELWIEYVQYDST